MKTYPFSALFSRMKYITRWCLMRSTRPESLSEHTADTAMLAHTLCLIGRRAQRYPPLPATAIFRQSSGTMAHGMSRAGTTMDSQKNGLPSR